MTNRYDAVRAIAALLLRGVEVRAGRLTVRPWEIFDRRGVRAGGVSLEPPSSQSDHSGDAAARDRQCDDALAFDLALHFVRDVGELRARLAAKRAVAKLAPRVPPA